MRLDVNHRASDPRYGILLCVNGAGIQYSWMRKMTSGEEMSYAAMGEEAASVPVGSDGLVILPFGNGAERILLNHKGCQVTYGRIFRH